MSAFEVGPNSPYLHTSAKYKNKSPAVASPLLDQSGPSLTSQQGAAASARLMVQPGGANPGRHEPQE